MDAESRSTLAAPSRRRWRIVFAVVWVVSASYVLPFVRRGWIPHDEGTLAQSAERVMRGEVPHRDFDEGYTGGLSYLHAAAFRLCGARLSTLRWVLYGAFLLFSAATFGIARRLGPAWLAALLALLAAAWSVPNYFAGLPSWYNLFLAAFTTLFLMRSIEQSSAAWIFASGLCAGASILIKQVGFYAVAAGLLFLVYLEQTGPSARRESGRRGRALFLAFKAAAIGVFIGLLAAVFGRRRELMDVLELVVPGAIVAGYLVWDDFVRGGGESGDRFRALVRMTAPFLAGVALVLAAFAAAFASAGSLTPLLRDVFVRSLEPTRHAQTSPLETGVLLDALPYALLLLFPDVVSARHGRRVAALMAVVLAAALALAGELGVYRAIWNSARSMPLVLAVAGVVLLGRRTGPPEGSPARAHVYLLVAMTALVSLVQFPYPSPIYFCYVAPLAGLAAAALVRADPRCPRAVHLVVLLFYLGFAVVWMNRGYVFQLGRYFQPYIARTPLDLPRGGILVPAADAREYGSLVRALAPRSDGEYMYAGPDCPEVYFLSARRNPTRWFFEYQGDVYGRPEELLRLLEEKRVKAVVLNRSPEFSGPPGPALRAELARRFPHAHEIGKFTLLWRD